MAFIAQMVIKNEADRYLVQVLEALSGVVDDIVITDDGSTDNSVDIAKSFTPNVYENKDSMFEHNEGHLRQNAWNNLERHANRGDWILCIDADEIINIDKLKAPLKTLLNQTRYNVLGIKFFHMWNETQYRADKAWAPNTGSRILRFIPGGSFSTRKLACGSEPSYIQEWIKGGRFLVDSGFRIKHLGYLTDEDKVMKHERYMKLDHGDYHSLKHIESIIDPNPTLIDWK